MKLIATLACRNNSSRLYGKPLQRLMDRSVVEYMIDRLKEHPLVHDIVLAISDTKDNMVYTDVAEANGLQYVLGDDKDVLKRLIRACELVGGDTVYRVTSESPFGYLEGLEEAVQSHEAKNADYTTHANLPDGVAFELISLEALQRSHAEGESRHRSELCTLYINENRDQFTLNILQVAEALQRPKYRLTIDYPEDLIFCRKIVEHFGGDHQGIPYQDLIAFLDTNPELRKLVERVEDENYIRPYHND